MPDKNRKMKLFAEHKSWWVALTIGSLLVAILTAKDLGIGGILGKTIGLLLLSLVLAGIPWLFYRLIKKPLTSTQIMSTITAIWILSVISQFMVAPPTDLQQAQQVVFSPPGCDYSVVFERTPKYYTTQKALADGALAPLNGAELTTTHGKGMVRAECVSLVYDFNSVKQDEAIAAMQQIGLDLGLSRPDFAFEEGKLGKVATLTGVKDTERGKMIARVINYHGPKSIMTLYVASLSSDFQTSEMTRFVQSIHLK
ncbi:MAG: hypothetical protein V3T23_04315 [Nitrososphaerales archaeon]